MAEHTWQRVRRPAKILHYEARPYVPGEDLANIAIGTDVKTTGGPRPGCYIVRIPAEPDVQWMVTPETFKEYEADPA